MSQDYSTQDFSLGTVKVALAPRERFEEFLTLPAYEVLLGDTERAD